MEEGLGPGAVAAVWKLSQEEEEGELGPQSLEVGGGGGVRCFLLIFGGLQRRSERVWSQHTPAPPFSVRSLEGEMLEREIMCLMSVALALVFPVAVKCCPGFHCCFPESRHWLLSLGSVVIRHSLHVMSSGGRAQPGCPRAVVILAAWCYQCPCEMCESHDDSESEIKSCGQSYWVQVCVCHSGRVGWHTSLKDEGGRNRYWPLTLLHQVCLSGDHPV